MYIDRYCRRELLDYGLPLYEEHLRRLVGDYILYFHEDRIQTASARARPIARWVQNKPLPRALGSSIIATPGGKQRAETQALHVPSTAGALRQPLLGGRVIPQIRGPHNSIYVSERHIG